jgi:hypothetical protein
MNFPSLTLKRQITLAKVLGVVTGLLAFVLTIFCVTRFVNSIHVDFDPIHWSHMARVQVYDLCYDGCSDCLDVSDITRACRKTALTQADQIDCDASKRWWWADEAAKYPKECLLVIGESLRSDQENTQKFWWRMLYLVSVLSIPLGFIVFLAANEAIEYFHRRRDNNTPATEPPTPQRPVGKAHHGARNIDSRTPLLAAAVIALALPTQVQGYACITHPAHNQLFSNPSRDIHGVIHGWLSNCFDDSYSCGESCSTSPTSGQRSCDTNWCHRAETDRTPRDYVNDVVPFVQRCGFKMVDYIPVIVDKRIPNSNIEERLKVKVSVSRFNGSDGVDEGVQCLYQMMVQPPKWSR